ncbi:hypothetical protein O0L34_g3060 [Tuta absoluta]|nr:hypothetical protein O0L34_g3060 [Tuta absoluta]
MDKNNKEKYKDNDLNNIDASKTKKNVEAVVKTHKKRQTRWSSVNEEVKRKTRLSNVKKDGFYKYDAMMSRNLASQNEGEGSTKGVKVTKKRKPAAQSASKRNSKVNT